ncbi:MAG: tetratricopeptide repeat protein [Acidobacteria bacterium]|nr:tetratricopeptide repeat protein [Acidobacteriota bacterium]
MRQRLTRKDMKRDEVMEGLSRVVHFVQLHSRQLGVGLLAVLALIAGFALWQAIVAGREATANEELSAALEAAADPAAELSAAKPALAAVAEQFGGTRAGSIAHAYLGTIAAQAADLAAARQHWERFLERHHDHALAAGVERNLISLDRAEGKSAELAERLRAVLAAGTSALSEDSVLYELGMTLEQLGQREEALEIYARLVDEYPTSLYAGQARERTPALEAS